MAVTKRTVTYYTFLFMILLNYAAASTTTTQPTVTPIDCGNVTRPFSGSINYTSGTTISGSNVTYSCSTGYALKGEATRTCTDDGTWSGYSPTCITELSIHLTGGDTSKGRVEVSIGTERGTVCDDGWDDKDAKVVCTMLGYSNGKALFYAYSGNETSNILMDDVWCQGTEDSLIECSYRGWGIHDCNHHEAASVICYANDLQVRLVGGNRSTEGRLEVLLGGFEWGTVCDHSLNWTKGIANVVCGMLSYSNSSSVSNTFLGPGTDDLPVYNLFCTGEEASLMDCVFYGGGYCSYPKDMSVDCSNERETIPTVGSPSTTKPSIGSAIVVPLLLVCLGSTAAVTSVWFWRKRRNAATENTTNISNGQQNVTSGVSSGVSSGRISGTVRTYDLPEEDEYSTIDDNGLATSSFELDNYGYIVPAFTMRADDTPKYEVPVQVDGDGYIVPAVTMRADDTPGNEVPIQVDSDGYIVPAVTMRAGTTEPKFSTTLLFKPLYSYIYRASRDKKGDTEIEYRKLWNSTKATLVLLCGLSTAPVHGIAVLPPHPTDDATQDGYICIH